MSKQITLEEAIKISREIILRAEDERAEIAEYESAIGVNYNDATTFE